MITPNRFDGGDALVVVLKEEFCRSEAGDLFHKLEVKEISRESVSMGGLFLINGAPRTVSCFINANRQI